VRPIFHRFHEKRLFSAAQYCSILPYCFTLACLTASIPKEPITTEVIFILYRHPSLISLSSTYISEVETYGCFTSCS